LPIATGAFAVILKPVLALAALALTAGAAHAQSCGGPRAPAGSTVHGPVLQVLDGERLCVATGAARADWAELLVRGADQGPVKVEGALGSALLMSVAFGHDADCVVGSDGKADCKVDGQPLSALLKRPGALEVARAWIKRPAADAPVLLASR
jgi:hypothetical protein